MLREGALSHHGPAEPKVHGPFGGQAPVWACGAATGFDSGPPSWRRWIDRNTIAATARNADYQFWFGTTKPFIAAGATR